MEYSGYFAICDIHIEQIGELDDKQLESFLLLIRNMNWDWFGAIDVLDSWQELQAWYDQERGRYKVFIGIVPASMIKDFPKQENVSEQTKKTYSDFMRCLNPSLQRSLINFCRSEPAIGYDEDLDYRCKNTLARCCEIADQVRKYHPVKQKKLPQRETGEPGSKYEELVQAIIDLNVQEVVEGKAELLKQKEIASKLKECSGFETISDTAIIKGVARTIAWKNIKTTLATAWKAAIGETYVRRKKDDKRCNGKSMTPRVDVNNDGSRDFG